MKCVKRIKITAADSISLKNQDEIATASESGNGGNITLSTNQLQLQNNSSISASAGGEGNGGNIDITANTIVALKDSDITATAFKGNGAAQSRWREPKELILNRSEILSITCFSLLIITLNLRKTQEGKWSKNQVVRDWHSRTTWFFDSRFLLPSWGSQIKERLIRECQSRIPPQADSFVWRSPRFLVLG